MEKNKHNPPYHTSNDHDPSNKSSRRDFMKLIGVGALIATGTVAANKAPQIIDMVNQRIDTSKEPLNDYTGGYCEVAPPEARVRELAAIHENAVGMSDTSLHDVAHELDLSLVDRDELDHTIEAMRGAPDYHAVVEEFSKFTEKNFGIFVQVDDLQLTVLVEANNLFAEDMAVLLERMSRFPKEFYDTIKLSQIAIENTIIVSNAAGDTLAANGTYSEDSETISLDWRVVAYDNTYLHELGHAVSNASCNGIGRDTAFADTNPEAHPYGAPDYNGSYPKDVFAEPYGQENSDEDSATVFKAWVTGELYLTGENSPLQDKLAIVLDRVERLAPGTVEFIERTRYIDQPYSYDRL